MQGNAYMEGPYRGRRSLGGVVGGAFSRLFQRVNAVPRQLLIGVVLLVALAAFEVFNFDTTQFALNNLLGDVRFMGLAWASILATAFCAIDFAGLVRMFTPEQGRDEPREVWFLMGAWLLGATMNALMTWWAISLTLINHDLGNEVLSREQLLKYAPIFVAVLVWLTRILFIGSLSVTGERMFAMHRQRRSHGRTGAAPRRPAGRPVKPGYVGRPGQRAVAAPQTRVAPARRPAPAAKNTARPRPAAPRRSAPPKPARPNVRQRSRPTAPRAKNNGRRAPVRRGVQAHGRDRQ